MFYTTKLFLETMQNINKTLFIAFISSFDRDLFNVLSTWRSEVFERFAESLKCLICTESYQILSKQRAIVADPIVLSVALKIESSSHCLCLKGLFINYVILSRAFSDPQPPSYHLLYDPSNNKVCIGWDYIFKSLWMVQVSVSAHWRNQRLTIFPLLESSS